MINIQSYIKDYPNFPKDGIIFKDICPLLRSPDGWGEVMRQLGYFCEEINPDCIVGIESRGFIVGTALATRQRMSFIPIRKKGKLPGEVASVDYTLEYGKDTLEMQSDTFTKGTRVLLVDDLLATGGTAGAASDLINLAGGNLVGCAFIIELSALEGRQNLPNVPIRSLINYD